MQHLGTTASTLHSPEMDMSADELIDVGAPCTTAASATAAAASPVGDQTILAAPEKLPYGLPAGGALGMEMDHGTSTFDVNIGGDSLEDMIAGDVDEFIDVFRALDGQDGRDFADGLNAADQGMKADDDEFAWLNSPDAFMPRPIEDKHADGLGEVVATAIPTGEEREVNAGMAMAIPTGEKEEEEEAGMAMGAGDDNMEDVSGGSLLTGLAEPELPVEIALAAAVAATKMLPSAELEGDTAELSSSECAVSPHAPAYDLGEVEEAGRAVEEAGGAGYSFAGGPADAADGVGVAAAAAVAVTATATNLVVNGGGGGNGCGHGGRNCGLSQKELIRRQKVERYLAKKKRRRWSRGSTYQSRQRVANSRPRHKGRFLPLVSDFVPISELKRRHRALLAQQAEEEEEKQASLPPLAGPGWGASAQLPPHEN